MTISGAIQQGIDVAVFTRNHREHLEEAVSISATDPNRNIVFRAQTKWASASDALIKKSPRDLYIAPVSGSGLVEYVADLHGVHFDPQRGQLRTEELLRTCLESFQ